MAFMKTAATGSPGRRVLLDLTIQNFTCTEKFADTGEP